MSLSGINFEFVNSVDMAEEFLRWLGERRPIISIDSETCGLDWWKTPFTRLVQFGDPMRGYALSAHNWRGLVEIAMKHLRDSNDRIAMHNAKFDMHALAVDGFTVPKWNQIDDTRILHHLLLPSDPHGLKILADRFIDPQASIGQAMLQKGMIRNGWNWETVPEEFEPYTSYAAVDTILTARLWEQFKPQVDARFSSAYDREMIVQEVMFDAETRGVHIDWQYATQLSESYRSEMLTLQVELNEYGIRKPGSGSQIEAALRDEGWEPDVFTPTGKAKTSEEVLRGIDSEIVPKVIRFKRLQKWSSAYLHHFLDERDQFDCVHPSINTMEAKTGRMSITRPGLQTLPKGREIRDCITAIDGNELTCLDYSNIELRLAASFSEDPFLMSAFTGGVDMHNETARIAFGTDFTPKDRQKAKNGRYALLYGAGVEKAASTLGISEAEVIAIRDAIDIQSPNLKRYGRQLEDQAAYRNQTENLAYIDTWGGRIATAESDKLYKLLNYKIQGSAADIFKESIVTLYKKGLDEYIVIPVHDELVMSTPKEDSVEIMKTVQECLEYKTEFTTPIDVHISKSGKSWGDCVD